MYSFYVVEPHFFSFFKWQYRAEAGAGAKIRENVKPELEPKLKIFDSATLNFILFRNFRNLFFVKNTVHPQLTCKCPGNELAAKINRVDENGPENHPTRAT